ncbi:P-loop containing nucleoside triphosphate hydrolase protein [Gongronella butleri]|nr:P-loop containing nucleoside triphosphate hydrolase protein [Gongronella butleri]
MDDDGLLLNLAPARPAKVREGKNDKEASKETAKEGAASKEKVQHGKAQVQSSLFTANPTYEVEAPQRNAANKVEQTPSNAPTADAASFEALGLGHELITTLASKLQVTRPTVVQQRALPVLLGPAFGIQAINDPLDPTNKTKQDADVVVQAQTGSGKTLTYLLPMIQRLVAASTFGSGSDCDKNHTGFGDRSIGTVGIILTPTRELAQQVTQVLQQLLVVGRPKDETYRRTHWMVAGMVIGGDNKAKEKARLRKGINLLVSTPGRLLDHLQNTKSFNVTHLKWLVLDEADRLLDLGFEETLKQIMQLIHDRTSAPPAATFRHALSHPLWPRGHQTILCSATLRDDVRQLAGMALAHPVFISANAKEQQQQQQLDQKKDEKDEETFSAPAQLKQTATIVPAKLRLISLIAMLRHRIAKNQKGKIIVFFSCCDSVDFHYDLLAKAADARGKGPLGDDDEQDRADLLATLYDDDDDDDDKEKKNKRPHERRPRKTKKQRDQEQLDFQKAPCQVSKMLAPDNGTDVHVYRLHGDLPQDVRTATFQQFNAATQGILLCTDVAARGLDLPNVASIIQYDPPTDMKDYVHRIGRTARLGKAGEARLFLLPSEMDYLPILKGQGMAVATVTVESLLADAFGRQRQVYEAAAQEIQDLFERYVLSEEENVLLARKAYWSSVRAYATHAAAEKHIFHVKKLHLGHIAKSFALREAPSHLQDPNKSKKKKDALKDRMPGKMKFRDNKGGAPSGPKPPQKRKRAPADEFAIISSASITTAGPTTKKKKQAMAN